MRIEISDRLKKEVQFWGKFVVVLCIGYGVWNDSGGYTAIAGLYAAWHIARLHKLVAAHTAQLKDKRRLP